MTEVAQCSKITIGVFGRDLDNSILNRGNFAPSKSFEVLRHLRKLSAAGSKSPINKLIPYNSDLEL